MESYDNANNVLEVEPVLMVDSNLAFDFTGASFGHSHVKAKKTNSKIPSDAGDNHANNTSEILTLFSFAGKPLPSAHDKAQESLNN